MADTTVPAPVIALSHVETDSGSHINIGGYVYILFDASSGSASIYKCKIKSYNFVCQKYTVYFSADETEYKWTVYKPLKFMIIDIDYEDISVNIHL